MEAIKRSGRDRTKQARLRRLGKYRNKRLPMDRSKEGGSRLVREPPVSTPLIQEKKPLDDVVQNDPFLGEESTGSTNDQFPEETSEDTLSPNATSANDPFPGEESEDTLLGDLPNENLFSSTGSPSSAPISSSTTTPPNDSSTSSPTVHGQNLAPSVPSPGIDPTELPKKTYSPAYFLPLATPRPTNYRPSLPSPPPPTTNTKRPTNLSPRPTNGPTVSRIPSQTPTLSPAPTELPTKTYSPAYFSPLATPRPTNYRPSLPSPPPPTTNTKRPTNLSPRPTNGPTVSRIPTQTPTLSPAPSPAPTPKAPTLMPIVYLETEAPTFRSNQTETTTRRPTVFVIDTEAPTFRPITKPPNATEAPNATPPTISPTVVDAIPPSVPIPTVDPSAPTLTTTTSPTVFDPILCFSNEEGDFGFPTAPVVNEIGYRFQVQTTPPVEVDDLNADILPPNELKISDVLIQQLFDLPEACQGYLAQNDRPGPVTNDARTSLASGILLKRNARQPKLSKRNRTDGSHWRMPSEHDRRLLWDRRLQEPDELVGLRAAPPDAVLRGRLQNACPFPVAGTGPDGQALTCWVIEGALSIYGFGNLTWVDGVLQRVLSEAMARGDFDDGVVDPRVIYVRHIPPGTVLNGTTEPEDEAKAPDGGSSSISTPIWAWILIGLGVLGLVLSIVYIAMKRKQQMDEFERQKTETEFFTGENADLGGDGDERDEFKNEGDGIDVAAGEEKDGEEKDAFKDDGVDDPRRKS